LKLNKITDGALIRIVSLFKQLLKDLSKTRLNTRVGEHSKLKISFHVFLGCNKTVLQCICLRPYK